MQYIYFNNCTLHPQTFSTPEPNPSHPQVLRSTPNALHNMQSTDAGTPSLSNNHQQTNLDHQIPPNLSSQPHTIDHTSIQRTLRLYMQHHLILWGWHIFQHGGCKLNTADSILPHWKEMLSLSKNFNNEHRLCMLLWEEMFKPCFYIVEVGNTSGIIMWLHLYSHWFLIKATTLLWLVAILILRFLDMFDDFSNRTWVIYDLCIWKTIGL